MNTTKKTKMLRATINKPMHKKWLYASLAAAALTLSACADKEAPMSEDETAMDAQAEVEQGATGVANEDIAVASEDTMNDDIAVVEADDGVAVGVDDSEMLDGSESEEHVSTY